MQQTLLILVVYSVQLYLNKKTIYYKQEQKKKNFKEKCCVVHAQKPNSLQGVSLYRAAQSILLHHISIKFYTTIKNIYSKVYIQGDSDIS